MYRISCAIAIVALTVCMSFSASAQEPEDKIIGHLNNLTGIIESNMKDPDLLIEQFTAYIEQNREDMELAAQALEEKLNKMSPEEREQFEKDVDARMMEAMSAFLDAIAKFQEKYPEKAEELGKALQDF